MRFRVVEVQVFVRVILQNIRTLMDVPDPIDWVETIGESRE